MQRKTKLLSLFLITLLTVSLAFVFVPKVSATTIFSDGFECPPNTAPATFTAWSGTDATPLLNSTYVKSGSYSVKCSALNDQVRKTTTSSYSDVYFRLYAYFPNLPASGKSVSFSTIYDTSWGGAISLTVNSAGQFWFGTSQAPTAAVAGQLYCIEMQRTVGTGNGVAKLWIDDVSQVNRTAETFSSNAQNFIAGWRGGDADTSFTLFLDDVVIADAYIGPLVVGDTTVPTYSTPTTNTTVASANCNFTVSLADNVALANYTFGSNNTGSWVNASAITISGTSYLSNTTLTLNATIGNIIQWEVWFADSSNNLNNTGLQTITLTGTWTKTYLGGNTQSSLSTWIGTSTNQINPFGVP
jgi:hypothetical protein